MKDRWKVVTLHRFKKEEVVSRHWWHLTAWLAMASYIQFDAMAGAETIYDVWRI